MEQSGICHVVGAGDFSPRLLSVSRGDFVIAADGGLSSLEKAGIRPDLILGDFDSLGFLPEGDAVVVLPKEKDVTDLFAAAMEGKARGYRRFFFYGALGGSRFSHSMANLSLLLSLKKEGLEGQILHEYGRILLLGVGEHRPDVGSGYFSLFAAERDCLLSIEAAKYPLDHATLSPDFPLGVSNEGSDATCITVHRGLVFLVTEPDHSAQREQTPKSSPSPAPSSL